MSNRAKRCSHIQWISLERYRRKKAFQMKLTVRSSKVLDSRMQVPDVAMRKYTKYGDGTQVKTMNVEEEACKRKVQIVRLELCWSTPRISLIHLDDAWSSASFSSPILGLRPVTGQSKELGPRMDQCLPRYLGSGAPAQATWPRSQSLSRYSMRLVICQTQVTRPSYVPLDFSAA